MSFIISTETTSDFSKERLEKLNIKAIEMVYYVDGECYGQNGKVLPLSTIYEKMKTGSKITTSMANEYDAEEFFSSLLKEGKDILHVSLSSACSGTCNNLIRVANNLNAKNKNKIYVLDSKTASTGVGLLSELAIKFKNQGLSAKETYDKIASMVDRLNSIFTVDDLKYLASNGRIPKSAAIIGNIVNVKPLLYVDLEGNLTKGGKTLGSKKALTTLIKMVTDKWSGEYEKIYVSHALRLEDAIFVKERINAHIPEAEIEIEEIGPVVGSHGGPGSFAIFFFGKEKSFN